VEFQRNADQQLKLSSLGGVETVEDVGDVDVVRRAVIMRKLRVLVVSASELPEPTTSRVIRRRCLTPD
jgi:hypothetical protein